MKDTGVTSRITNAAVICMCFLLTSSGYLAWVYHLMELVTPRGSDALSMVTGYAMQALGILLFSLLLRRTQNTGPMLFGVLVLHMLCLVPAVLSHSVFWVLLYGSVLNLLIGWIEGYYLHRLTCGPNAARSAFTLGIGYSVSILVSWILSVAGGSILYYSDRILLVCLVMTIITLFVLYPAQRGDEGQEAISSLYSAIRSVSSPENRSAIRSVNSPENRSAIRSVSSSANSTVNNPVNGSSFAGNSLLLHAAVLVFLFSVVNSCGFGFPSADLKSGISLEFSRLFYAAGLLVAGFLNDRSRKYGAVCALAALIIPFIMLALQGEQVPLLIFWALSYFTFGFYSIYRMVLFSDLARRTGLLYLSGYGLLIGRIGDSFGEAACLLLEKRLFPLLGITGLFFIVAVFVLFRIFPVLYLPAAPAAGLSEKERGREIFQRFCAGYELSAREREVLQYLLEEKTGAEIADAMSISEGTVKYHIHNLLQKTGCRNRIALLDAYFSQGKE